MNEQDRIYANEYHFRNYERIYNAKDLEEARKIALNEMKIIQDDLFIENDEEETKKELATEHQSNN